MAKYILGDLHGCYDEFMQLLDKVKFDENSDELLLTGDLIGRGPSPVETLKQILKLKKKRDCVHNVLGNHDVNFLSVYFGIVYPREKDNITVLLNSDIVDETVDFFRKSPLLYLDHKNKLAMAHAGVYPKWTLDEASSHALEVEKLFKDESRLKLLLRNAYLKKPPTYSVDDADLSRWRFILNSFTTMRLCDKDLLLDFGHSNNSLEEAEADGLYPWFNFGAPCSWHGDNYRLFFGHWAALKAQCPIKNITALDTGCVWGGSLSCYCFDTGKTVCVPSKVKVPIFKKKKLP